MIYTLKYILVVFIMITTAINVSAETELHPWFALSTIWGQGNAGINMGQEKVTYGLSYNFVAKWFDWDFTYHEVALYRKYDDWTLGFKYRHQLSQDEWTPYAGYFLPLRDQFFTPMSLYNEVEYRINSVVKEGDYVRTRHIYTMYAPKSWVDVIYLKPYVALDAFIDWEDVRREKVRLNVGYFINLKRAVARIYCIPWSKGIQEEEWDDQVNIGATLIYKW